MYIDIHCIHGSTAFYDTSPFTLLYLSPISFISSFSPSLLFSPLPPSLHTEAEDPDLDALLADLCQLEEDTKAQLESSQTLLVTPNDGEANRMHTPDLTAEGTDSLAELPPSKYGVRHTCNMYTPTPSHHR